MSTSKITIRTALSDGIYRRQGGGETRTHYEWRTGPINLLRAIRQLNEHRRDMDAGYGNIGHAGSWIEIDGERLDRWHVEMTETLDDARRLIDHATSGTYARDVANSKAAMDRAISEWSL